jgi:hypothetical protein
MDKRKGAHEVFKSKLQPMKIACNNNEENFFYQYSIV